MSDDHSLQRLVKKLDQDPALPSKDLYKVLVTIRTKHMSQESVLIQEGIVTKLVQHLKRPNAKIVDVVLSILGNLMLQDEARKQIKPHLRILTSILSTLSEESILARTCRSLANIAQDHECAKILKSLGLLLVLVKTLNELKAAKAKAPAVRALRILGSLEKKEKLLSSNAIAAISSCLSTEDEELLKAVTKCLAKFTNHGCDNFIALQIQGEGQGFQRLVECCKHESRGIWEPALASLVNLSFVESLRPNLGNAGVIFTFIIKAQENGANGLSPGDFFRTISALCLYCHESVNRMKIRDAGGLRLFVAILQDEAKDKIIKDKIIKSLMQFAYDDSSLKVLQYVGLVPALVKMIECYNVINKVTRDHTCEDFICNIKHDVDEMPNKVVDTNDSFAHNDKSSDENKEESNEAEIEALINEESNHEFVEEPRTEERQYRINSPSYREVQGEVEEFAKIRAAGSSWMSSSTLGLSPFHSRSPSASPRSSSPVPSYHASCLSSAESSPMTDPEERCPPTYSPIETFSDEEDDSNVTSNEKQQPSTSSKRPLDSQESWSSPKRPSISSSPSYITMYQPMYLPPTIKRSFSTSSATSNSIPEEQTQTGMILQILSRYVETF